MVISTLIREGIRYLVSSTGAGLIPKGYLFGTRITPLNIVRGKLVAELEAGPTSSTIIIS